MCEPLLSVRDLEKHYPVRSGLLRRVTGHVAAVDGVSFDVNAGEAVGLVGESGCGKSTTATTLLGLEEPTGGSVVFDGEDVTAPGGDTAAFRRRTGIVFQDPNTAFDPRLTVGESVAEPLAIHGMADERRRRRVATDLLDRVGLDADDADRYPRELSDGQKQRVALARALVLNPDLLVADEPVSALDVSVQAEVLSLLGRLRSELDLSVLLISHDLGVVREVCDRVAVMYLGEVVERGPAEALFRDPQHPYTEALVASIPRPDPSADDPAVELTGDVPDPADPPSGCSFHPRCPRVVAPDEYDLGASFRGVLDLRLAAGSGDTDPGEFADERDVRTAFGLPDELPDPEADAVLSAAIDDLLAGDPAAAADRLREAFPTVCARDDPSLVETGAGHPAACHLHTTGSGTAPPDSDSRS